MKRVGFITNSQFPHLTDSDSLTITPLKNRGIEVEPIIWSSPPPTLNQFDAIIMRSAWDYHLHINKFITFLNILKQSRIKTFNGIDTMLWNMDKSYLLELNKKNIPIVPTIKVGSIGTLPWEKLRVWEYIVIKPCHGGSAYHIDKLNTKDDNKITNTITKLLKSGNVLIQPFMKEIHEGEISFIFFNKQFSHAMLKKPIQSDFRTQPEFGGTETRIYPSEDILKAATNILQKIKRPLLYTRLDAISVNGSLQLMELELIEPHLFLEDAPEKAVMFADAITRVV